MKTTFIADTHNKHQQLDLPGGDLLVVAGDFCSQGEFIEVHDFASWLDQQPYDHKVVIAGNHEVCMGRGASNRYRAIEAITDTAVYLEDSQTTVEGLVLHGVPWTNRFGSWAFMKDEDELSVHWNDIPSDTDILITHGPPRGVLDECPDRTPRHDHRGWQGPMKPVAPSADRTKNVGSTGLLERLREVQPDYHVFGHIHESYGRATVGSTTCLNASVVNGQYEIQNDPVTVNIAPPGNDTALSR